MRNPYHSAILPALGAVGGFRLMRRLCRQRALVLAYHGVVSDDDPELATTNKNHVSSRAFRWQMEHLRRHYDVVGLHEVIRRLRDGEPVGGLAAVTLDDGYRNVLTEATPILLELGVPATVFIIAGLVGSKHLTWYDKVELCVLRFPGSVLELEGDRYELGSAREPVIRRLKARLKTKAPDDRHAAIEQLAARAPLRPGDGAAYSLMDWPEILDLKRRGITFGVHSHSHPNLSQVDSSELGREVDEAAQTISERLDVSVNELCFSYPDGDHDQRVRDRVAAVGLFGAVAVAHRLVPADADPFAVPRVTVDRNQTPAMFQDATVGLARRLKKLLPL